MRQPDSLADIVRRDLALVREDRPLTGVPGAVVTLASGILKTIIYLFLATVMAAGGFLLTQSAIGAGVFALSTLVLGILFRKPHPFKVWRDALRWEGFSASTIDGVTEMQLRVPGPVTVTYRFAPGDDVRESVRVHGRPQHVALEGDVHALRLRGPIFDGGLELQGSPAVLACVTARTRAALTAIGRSVTLNAGGARFAIDSGPFDVPADVFDALAAAIEALAIDMADPTPALLRISAQDGSDAALFDAARASALLLADDLEPQAAAPVIAGVRACMAGDFEALITTRLTPAQRTAVCRGVYRAGVITDGAFDRLCVGAQGLPETEAGCIDAIGLLCALESPEARARFERLAAIGSMSAAHWLGDSQFPTEHGLQAAADAARAALHGRLHVHGALSIRETSTTGGVSLVKTHGE